MFVLASTEHTQLPSSMNVLTFDIWRVLFLHQNKHVKHTYIHNIMPVFPEGLGRGVPMYTHGSPVCFRSHVIGGEPIANNRAQILTPSCYWEFNRKTQ